VKEMLRGDLKISFYSTTRKSLIEVGTGSGRPADHWNCWARGRDEFIEEFMVRHTSPIVLRMLQVARCTMHTLF
jgi:hypothetical protein